ncbi:enoyl-CoA hydratase [Mycolicibacterium baixiangningiae]|uniref:enoyl-CoA hydratase n=1 Tax=Mycolicibacterium baixiangningiae TaxID=2761578 RepID=UPI0018681936|nr:enoyl-CoA hydratase [Mycolicibacterium baixiangningiae]
MDYETILVTRDGRVGTITLNRPKALNALNSQVMVEVTTAAAEFDDDEGIGAIVITGSEKAFAAGADIKEMANLSFADVFTSDFFALWGTFAATRTPTIAAVAGYALGGGCELAMMCDILIAADTAKFGQPEIKLGVLPGMGGSQRLTRAIGKAKAMDLILTGRTIGAEEADRSGLVSRVVPADRLLDEANEVAAAIAGMSRNASRMAKEAVNRAFESTLTEGLLYERRLFHSAFATEDQKEGMAAFSEKRPANFTHR